MAAPTSTSPPASKKPINSSSIPNINVGVLGHVDSGKTSLVRVLSTKYSTASLDKHPQSKDRGITLDLGFSAFTTATPGHLKGEVNSDTIQYTLVDCPGHASLIKTIIGGAQIIDRMLLVIDVTKGIQTQTAECLVIGEILTNDLIVVLNKVDLIEEPKREAHLAKVEQAVRAALKTTRFKSAPMALVSAKVGGDGKAGVGENSATLDDAIETRGIEELVELIRSTTRVPKRYRAEGAPLYLSIDHCFSIKGQGTILTGTVLSGRVCVGDSVEVVGLSEEKKVKSIQMFHKAVDSAAQGDRAALCVTNLNAKLVERGIVATPGTVSVIHGAIALVRKVKYFQRDCPSSSKIHITIGHSTILSSVTFFGSNELKETARSALGKQVPVVDFVRDKDWEYDETLKAGGKAAGGPVLQWALLQFETETRCQKDSVLIGSRLDLDINAKECRIAFYGRISMPLSAEDLKDLSL